MNAVECIKTRRSVRRFTDEVISQEKFTEIVDLAKMAPSWKNTQTVRYLVVQDEKIINQIATEAVLEFEFNEKTLSKCKNVVLVTQINGRCGYEKNGEFTTSKGASWEMFDAGVATQTFCLAAHEYGIGTCILGVFDDEKIGKMVNLPEGQTVAAVIACGVPKFAPDPTPRKETAELISFM